MTVATNVAWAKYRTLLQLGEGGTANVYLAVVHGPSGFNKLVVMKTLKQNLIEDPTYVEMFLKEARISARLNHPNIVQTNEVAEDGPAPSIIMEYLEGQAFSAILSRARRGLSLGMSLRILVEVLSGLHYAHELCDYDGSPLSLVHRDVTPHNVFVTYEGQVKVLDFGIAKIASAGAQTQEGVLKGKIRYMPPEQIIGARIDRRADIFAVGVMLWEAIVGERLWSHHSDVTVMNNVLHNDIPPPSSVRADVNQDLDWICRKALAHDRSDRYATAAEFAAELEQVATSLGGLASNRELGRFVSERFANLRREIKASIDSQLSKVNSLSWDEYQATALSPPPFTLIGASKTGLTGSNAGPTQRSGLPPSTAGIDRRRLTWVLGGVAFAVVLPIVWHLVGTHSPNVANPPNVAPSAVPAPVVSEEPPNPAPIVLVTLRLEATPPEATLFLDGSALPSNPYTGSVPKGVHSIRAEAEGFVPKGDDLTVDKDDSYSFTLVRSKKPMERARVVIVPAVRPATAARPPPATPSTPAPPTTRTGSSGGDCAMPYFVDAQGIKKIKPECM